MCKVTEYPDGTPNQIAAPNPRLPLGPVPWSFAALPSRGLAVGEP